MKTIFAFTSVIALAITAPVFAQKPGNGNGNSDSKGAPQSAGKPDRGNAGNGNTGSNKPSNKPDRAEVREERTQGRSAQTSNTRSNNGNERDIQDSYERDTFNSPVSDRSSNNFRDTEARRFDERGERDRFQFTNDDDRRRFAVRYDQDFRPLSGFCPPGLAKKGNGCQPPGQAKKSDRNYLSSYSRFSDGGWRYLNGYAYRPDSGSDLINAFIPLVGGALFGGNQWPVAYQDYAVPTYYDRYYGRDDDYNYLYADQTIFSVDPQDQAIQGIVALLTGDNFEVGRQMPAGYDVYNVPSQYRDEYYDRPDASYRYSDGYVYQVDPTTQLIAAAIPLVV